MPTWGLSIAPDLHFLEDDVRARDFAEAGVGEAVPLEVLRKYLASVLGEQRLPVELFHQHTCVVADAHEQPRSKLAETVVVVAVIARWYV